MPIHFRQYDRHPNVHTVHFGFGDIEILSATLDLPTTPNVIILRQLNAAEQDAYDAADEAPAVPSPEHLRSIDIVLRFDTIRACDILIQEIQEIRQQLSTAATTAKHN